MAFIKLFPPDGGSWLTVDEVVRRLSDEFRYFHADAEEGRDHIAGMIAAMMKFSRELPGWQQVLESLSAVQEGAVVVEFGDSPDQFAHTCVAAKKELFFGSVDAIRGPARPFVERAARVLGYQLFGD